MKKAKWHLTDSGRSLVIDGRVRATIKRHFSGSVTANIYPLNPRPGKGADGQPFGTFAKLEDARQAIHRHLGIA